MKITRVKAVQAHPVPSAVYEPRGPFPAHIFEEPEIVTDYVVEDDEHGGNFEPGATSQNNYKPVKYYRCKTCRARVDEAHLSAHTCEE
jgi:uncharacterized protein YlaI